MCNFAEEDLPRMWTKDSFPHKQRSKNVNSSRQTYSVNPLKVIKGLVDTEIKVMDIFLDCSGSSAGYTVFKKVIRSFQCGCNNIHKSQASGIQQLLWLYILCKARELRYNSKYLDRTRSSRATSSNFGREKHQRSIEQKDTQSEFNVQSDLQWFRSPSMHDIQQALSDIYNPFEDYAPV